jgi:hypothetical protein
LRSILRNQQLLDVILSEEITGRATDGDLLSTQPLGGLDDAVDPVWMEEWVWRIAATI